MAPVLFTVPGLHWEVAAYGFFMGLALVVGWIVSLTLAKADRLPTEPLGTVYVVSAAAGVLTARAAWLVQHPEQYVDATSLLSLSADGLAPFFGIVVALVLSAVLVTRKKVPVTAWFDVVAPAFAVATILERIGALLAGAGYGRYAPELPFAITFPVGSPAYADHVASLSGLMPPAAGASLPVHPTQIYGALLGAVGLALALAVRKRRRFAGQVFMVYAIYLVAARIYVEEWFRADAVQPVFGPFNPGQVAAALLLVALVSILRTRAQRAGRIEGGLRYWEGGRWSPGWTPPGKGKSASRSASASSTAGAGRSKGRHARGKKKK